MSEKELISEKAKQLLNEYLNAKQTSFIINASLYAGFILGVVFGVSLKKD